MRISENQKIHKATSTDELRPALNHIYFDGEYLIATNGHIMARIKPDQIQESEKPGLIGCDVIKESLKNKRLETGSFECRDGDVVIAGNNGEIKYQRPETEIKYPDYKRIIDDGLKVLEKKHKKININPYLLLDLAEAMGVRDYLHNGIELFIPMEEDKKSSKSKMYVVKIRHEDENDRFGIIMGMREDE